MDQNPGITFNATFNKITSLVDGGIRISFDVSENELEQVLKLIKIKNSNLQIAVVTAEMISDYYGQA